MQRDCKNERASEYVSVLVGPECLLGRSRSDRRPVEVDEKGGVAKGKGPSGYQKEISSRVECKSPSLHSRLRIEDRLVVDGAVTGHGRALLSTYFSIKHFVGGTTYARPQHSVEDKGHRQQFKARLINRKWKKSTQYLRRYPIPSASPRTVSNVLMSEVPGTPHLHGIFVSKLPTRPSQFNLEAPSLRPTTVSPTQPNC
ncbi:hypothetical protein GE21DRAFT_7916 [Neurospora crassa]|uniref:Uncharacterized protein n=2 Tax=Neurospora crassa TaxID=5141 RepID=Q1K751_NEUCR|nr:hypothetical protein NCU06683 [Neurospora crassa OR74A]EAA31762.1 hypothetical protein NCU06683 [Neurospora crassa OR74A]KHE86964.1 hypothetical protein GE21DRAFT_7916 [Neurospora crassa]CAD70908.1 hypothetical protein [Neurospora crassa]|eukprot:XP_960998.1 hypothetical protein NCU06683 [Neurospora crassa OR74A]